LLLSDLETNTFSITRFYERRIRRIFPALFTMVGCTCIMGVVMLMPKELTGLGKSVVATTVFASNVRF
jgi:peptidoglycan/LPS O-acetylase OafA/YrhL